jgi:hypothetical protein
VKLKLWMRWLMKVLYPTPARVRAVTPRSSLRVEGLNERVNPAGFFGGFGGGFADLSGFDVPLRAGPGFEAMDARAEFRMGFGFFGSPFRGFFGGFLPRPEVPSDEAPAEAASFDVRLASKAYAGEETKLLVTPLDAENRPIPNYTGTIHFESSDPSVELPEDYTFTAADRGRHVFDVIAGTTGELTVTVTQVEAPAPEPEPEPDEPLPEEPTDGTDTGLDLILGEDVAALHDDGTDHEHPADPTKPVDETPTDPTMPVDPTKPVDETPADPTDPVDEVPTDPIDTPVDPTDPNAPIDETPTDPIDEVPTDPVDETPTDPDVPTDPDAPTDPIDETPTDPVEPPTDPTVPPVDETPTDPTAPTDPTVPPVDETPTDPTVPPTDPTVPPVDETPTDPTVPPVDETPTDPTDPTVPPVDETPTDPVEPPIEPPVDETPTDPTDPVEPPTDPVDVTGVITFDVSEAPVATHFALRALPGATAGDPTRFAVVPLDESNEPVANFTGTIRFTSSDPDAVLPADYTFTEADQGVHVFSAEFKAVGDITLTATADDGTTTGDVTVQVSEPAGDRGFFPGFFSFRPRGSWWMYG